MAKVRSVPREIRRAVQREHGERLLGAQQDDEGRWQVGTAGALLLQIGDDAQPTRIPWEKVESLRWDAEASTVTVVDTGSGAVRRTVLAFDGPGHLIELARERVNASILGQARVDVDAGRGAVTVFARRSPTRRGPITFGYLLDKGLSSETPEVQEATARALAEVRADLGMSDDASAEPH